MLDSTPHLPVHYRFCTYCHITALFKMYSHTFLCACRDYIPFQPNTYSPGIFGFDPNFHPQSSQFPVAEPMASPAMVPPVPPFWTINGSSGTVPSEATTVASTDNLNENVGNESTNQQMDPSVPYNLQQPPYQPDPSSQQTHYQYQQDQSQYNQDPHQQIQLQHLQQPFQQPASQLQLMLQQQQQVQETGQGQLQVGFQQTYPQSQTQPPLPPPSSSQQQQSYESYFPPLMDTKNLWKDNENEQKGPMS
eukprot:TRINITY_DN5320_c0_g1_i1.p1 TRINITY_DN5320_c0_g1~~TRINITY_DN5320_c0_g1_i1.p1  ORF type:complete len:249 (+),score=56.68 TRINITY_DN5320_c0_g1_i1:337-1083(+)